jgi:hypothetical protein
MVATATLRDHRLLAEAMAAFAAATGHSPG